MVRALRAGWRWWLFLLLLVVASSAASLGAASPPPDRSEAPYVPGEVLVAFKRGVVAADAVHARVGASVVQVLGGTVPVHRVQLPQRIGVPAAVVEYKKDPRVAFAEPNYIARAQPAAPNDPSFASQWALAKIQALDAWSLYPGTYYTSNTKPASAIKVAVVDTGIDYNHKDFINAGGSSSDAAAGGQIDRNDGFNFVNNSVDPYDDHGHGTHVSGILAASANNGVSYVVNGTNTGIAGVAYHAQVMPLKVLDNTGYGSYGAIANGIVRAADRGAVVINLSVGGTAYSQALQNAVTYAWSKGSVVIAAAGNSGDGTPLYPAACNFALGVAATDQSDQRAWFSAYGNWVGVAAPGVDILSTLPVQLVTAGLPASYGSLNGTSMAAPHVAGVAALYASANGIAQNTPGGNARIVRALQQGADNVAGTPNGGWAQSLGYGRLNAWRTLSGVHRSASVGSIVGAVYDNSGLALGGAIVSAGGSSAVSAVDGTYRIANLPAGGYSVSVAATGLTFNPQNVSVPPGADANATFTASSAPSLTPTSTATATPTPTKTATPTAAPSGTSTSTPTQTATGTTTATPTQTPTPTPTGTATPPPVSRWYFAEGSTQSGFTTFLLLENPNSAPATAVVTYYKVSGAPVVKSYALRAASRLNILVNNEVPNAALAMKVESTSAIYAERALYTRLDGHASHGIAAPSQTWYFAEGATTAPFTTWILLANPNNSTANATLTFMKESGTPVVRTFALAPNTRTNVRVNDIVPNAAVATSVSSDLPIVAERAMYFGTGSHGATGVPAPGLNWLLAEGYTGPGYETWILIANPGATPADVTVAFLGDGGSIVSRNFTVAARARLNVWANTIVPNSAFATKVIASQPVVAERAMYFGPSSARGGHNAEAASQPSAIWHFAEGSTQGGFNTFLLLMNPNNASASVTVSFLQEAAPATTLAYSVPPNSRKTIWVNQILSGVAFSAVVTSDQPIVAERAMYFNNNSGGTVSLGMPAVGIAGRR